MQALSRRNRAWLALLQVILLVVAVAMPAAASTSSNLLSGQKWFQLLQAYNIVRGDEKGDLKLDQPISRAEMTVIMVRALGAEQNSKLFRGLSPFDDVKGHWADAEISYAFLQKLVKGDGNGSFRPDSHITYAEALTLLLRLIGQEPAAGEWPFNVLLTAGDLGLVPLGVNAGNVSSEAVRGLIFQSLAKAAVDVKDSSGKNLLQNYLDQEPPKLTVTVPDQTENETLQISGSVKGAAAVTVNGKAVSLTSGSFASALTLNYGENPVTIVATDWAGNADTYSTKVVRPFPVSVLTITGPAKVAPGAKATYAVTALDNDGKPVSASLITAKVEGSIGTFDSTTGVLTASTTPGVTGKITVTAGTLSSTANVAVLGQSTAAVGLAISSINGGQAVAYTNPMTVSVQVIDASGNLIETDYGRRVALKVSGLQGATVTPATANTVAGVATFTVKAPEMGTVTLEATSAGLVSSSGSGIFGSTRRIRLIADPANLVVGSANSMARIKAELLNEDGQVVNNDTGEVIGITIRSQSEAGGLSDTSLTIAKGMSNSTYSGNDGMFAVYGLMGGSAVITGEVTVGPSLTVDPATLTVTVPQVGPGTKLSAVASQVLLEAPGTATFVIRLVDGAGNNIPTGEYAFQVRVETSNNETKTAGLPNDGSLTVTLGETGLNPVDDGVTEGASGDSGDIIARTTSGSAVVKVTYNKSGRVTLTPVSVSGTSSAYNAYGAVGSANSTYGFATESGSLSFQRPVGGIALRADSNIGSNQPAAAIGNNTASTTTLQVTITDSNGAWIPGQSRVVTLQRETESPNTVNTTPPASLTATTVDGKASFSVRGTATAGTDTYRVTIDGTAHSRTIQVQVDGAKPATPVIASVRGYKGSIPGSLNQVAPDEDGLEIVLLPGSNKWAQAKVYAEHSYSPIYTSGAINFGDSEARILVPKSLLPAGSQRYWVSLVNGFGESDRSEYSAYVMNATYNSYITITSAQYDAATRKLYVTGSGFNYSSSQPDTIITSALTLKDLSTNSTVSLSGAEVQISYSGLTLTLTPTMAAAFQNPNDFAGSDLRLVANAGWYVRYSGEVAAADQNDNPVTPGARITNTVLDRPNRRLHVYGEGFSTGDPIYSKFRLTYSGAPAGDTFTLDAMSPLKRSDSELIFSLSDAAIGKLDTIGDDVDGSGNPVDEPDYVVEITEDGWFRTSSGQSARPASAFPIFTKLTLGTVTYNDGRITITGSGFDFAKTQVFPGQIRIVDTGSGATIDLGEAGKAATVESVTSTAIVLVLSADHKTLFETGGQFSGSDIYLRANDGWAQDNEKRNAAKIGDYDLRFPSR